MIATIGWLLVLCVLIERHFAVAKAYEKGWHERKFHDQYKGKL